MSQVGRWDSVLKGLKPVWTAGAPRSAAQHSARGSALFHTEAKTVKILLKGLDDGTGCTLSKSAASSKSGMVINAPVACAAI